MLWLLLLINLTILMLELPALLKNQRRTELAVFTVLFVIGLYFSLAFYFNWPLKEPFNAITAYMESQGRS